jgi:DamX protein
MTNCENIMPASDLQDRLQYLVSYSSQLMFISSDVARQSSILDTFIAQSSDQIEVALLSAATTTPLAKYREKLYRQLISQSKIADFNRPLNQLLSELNQHDGPIIISITKAENLPSKLVKELWELVLQSRFTKNKQHLNILVFAQEAWARQAQKALSSKSGDKPLLINSTTSVQSLQNEMSTDLDKLIALKRKNFAERLQQRTNAPQSQQPLLKRKSVIGGFIFVFVALFLAMLSWLYPEKVAELLNRVKIDKSPAIIQGIDLNAESIVQEIAPVPTADSDENALSTPQDVTAVKSAETIEEFNLANNSNADPLVTDWQTAISQVERNSAQFLQLKSVHTAELTSENSSTNTTLDDNLAEFNNVSEEQVIRPPEQSSDSGKQNELSNQFKPLSQLPWISPIPLNKLTTNGTYLIQILAMSDRSLLEQNIKEQNVSEQLWYYETQRFGGSWHVLIYNHVYPSFSAAKAAIDSLPANLLAQSPFVKSAIAIQQEITANVR